MRAKVLNLLNPRKQSLHFITRNASTYGVIPPKPGYVSYGIRILLIITGVAIFTGKQISKYSAYALESSELYARSDDDDDDD